METLFRYLLHQSLTERVKKKKIALYTLQSISVSIKSFDFSNFGQFVLNFGDCEKFNFNYSLILKHAVSII